MDNTLLKSEIYQRPFQYLRLYSVNGNLDLFSYNSPDENVVECLTTLLNFCNIENPSWAELGYFSKFLNVQLRDCEESNFCKAEAVVEDSGFAGFKQFVVRFIIRMSQDFATTSLNVDNDNFHPADASLLEMHQLRRHWENGFHPYLFFNSDRVTMTFVNFNVNKHGDLRNPKSNEIIERNLMQPSLFQSLTFNGVNLQHDVDALSRNKKLALLSQVFGIDKVIDPDPTYELTTDNVLKMLAIQMRFRCGIPVVMMGETGCGKTRMIDFMSKLKASGNNNIKNMIVIKVHGGVTASMVQQKVLDAIQLALDNAKKKISETILFLDEANTTEAIYAVKEIVCDETVRGKTFKNAGLKIVAACNPYRLHKPEIIQKMENSGLGFHVKSQDVHETFDGIPMRHLVYRVISLPPSMQPLVWDFGQLNNETEGIYIKQMVLKLQTVINSNVDLPNLAEETVTLIARAIAASQFHMRARKDVCSFVSLRDAERTIQTFKWFYKHLLILNSKIEIQKNLSNFQKINISFGLRSMIQALSVCYHATLTAKSSYRELLAKIITDLTNHTITEKNILEEIIACQNVFIQAIDLEPNIACNNALRENVFMIVICSELRIPLFLVGKPGSSKSLAKTIVADAMQGRNSKSDLFCQLKEVHILSFQCSAATDAVGIEAVFSQCAQLQKERDCNRYVATVVLDEIGLAEDSKKMPLKVLHPLLETSSINNHMNSEPYQKVGFVGISNWALDPAKMNRGIFVIRDNPTDEDLHKTAEAIFESDKTKLHIVSKSIKALTDAYMKVYQMQDREFFGLRDYYALLKMLHSMLSQNKTLTDKEIGTAIIRNFSGQTNEIFQCFQNHYRKVVYGFTFPHISTTQLIYSNLNSDFETRFLLLLTKQYSAVNLLPEVMKNRQHYIVIFGSSFPHDHDYTEVCRNINKIKVCMETGQIVVLLNLRDLYESLYDALNQHYVSLAGQKYVDLGLGGHRVKCRVAPQFRLIVIEEKEVVYQEYPIPLINRLEKHVFEMNSILTPNESLIVQQLKEWVSDSSKLKTFYAETIFHEKNMFVGYTDDTCASALLSIDRKSFEKSQKILMQTASLDGICRLPQSKMCGNVDSLLDVYMKEQIHDSLITFLIEEMKQKNVSMNEIVSFSQILNAKDKQKIEIILNIAPKHLMLLTLQLFQTEQQFSNKIDEFFQFVSTRNIDGQFILLIQCAQAHFNNSLIACAKYSTMNKIKRFKSDCSNFHGSVVVCFLLTMERQSMMHQSSKAFTTFYSQDCTTVFIDELKPSNKSVAPVNQLWKKSVHDVFESGIGNGGKALVDAKLLFKESIQKAMAKLKNRVIDLNRNRIQLLLKLSFQDEIESPFYEIILKKIAHLLEDREKRFPKSHWIVDQACSSKSLQEGGTFQNVLWLYLKNIIAYALAKIVSVADADSNLDLIVNDKDINSRLIDLWYCFFNQNDLWDMQWPVSNAGSNYDVFYVEGYPGFNCMFPFSRLVFDLLLKEWSFQQEQNITNKKEKFVQRISTSSLQSLLNGAERIGVVAIKSFIHDLIFLMYKPRLNFERKMQEFEVAQEHILQLFELQWKNVFQKSNALIHVFFLVHENLKQLNQFFEVLDISPGLISEKDLWLKNNLHSNKFVLHYAAFESLIIHLAGIAKESFSSADTCQDWKLKVVKTKQISDKLLSSSSIDVCEKWSRITFVEMFLEELIPVGASPETVKQYLKPLSKQARLLWSGAEILKNLSIFRFLKIVMTSLVKSTKEIEILLVCNWQPVTCKACRKDVKEPVLLSCKHWFCFHCVKQNSNGKCPFCRIAIKMPKNIQPTQLTYSQKNELELFKSACTSFFLEYLSTLCFPPSQNINTPPPDDEIRIALEELVVCKNKTKSFSPVLSRMDLNPTARSYILHLLLRYNEDLVEEQLEKHFEKFEQVLNDRAPLMEMFLQCKQDLLLQQSLDGEATNYFENVEFAYNLLQLSLKLLDSEGTCSQLQHLHICAMLQFIAKVAAHIMIGINIQKISPQQLSRSNRFIKVLTQKCCDSNFFIFHQFLIKWLCRRYGIDKFNKMQKNFEHSKLIPKYLLIENNQKVENYLFSDKFSLMGETYLQTKTLLLDIVQEVDIKDASLEICSKSNSVDEMTQVLLAVSLWTAHGKKKNLRQQLFQFVFNYFHQRIPMECLQYFHEISQGKLEEYQSNNTTLSKEYELAELIVHFGVILYISQDYLISAFQQMIRNPTLAMSLYLPTMAGTNYNAIQAALGQPRLHLCPNGHPYYIGECTRPVERGKCTECGAQIGGLGHKLDAGNYQGQISEQSQAGYKVQSMNTVAPERNLTKLSVCATRICLHISMILGSNIDQAISRYFFFLSNSVCFVSIFLNLRID